MSMDIQQNVFFDDVRSTGSIVSDVLRRAIVTQSLPAGTRLVEAKLAKQLNVSITPIRQAFAQLAREGLLNVFPYKGTFVATITEKYLTDLMEVRRSIEATALTLCFASITTENVETLQDYTAKSQLALQNSQIYDAIKYDLLFHDFFFHKCGNLLLSEMWSLIRNRIMFVQSYTKQRKLPAGYTPVFGKMKVSQKVSKKLAPQMA